MNYEKFAYLYDRLMLDAPYEQWVAFVLEVIKRNEIVNGKILDIGCGTGNVSIPISKCGFDVTAVDLSDEMLTVAKEKNDTEGTSVKFFQQDMRDLEGLGTFDVVISLCDSLNYLHNENELASTFQKVYDHLGNDGIFIFDVHSIYKIDKVFIGNTFADSGGEIAYIWESFIGESNHSVEHELSFFIENRSGLYERFDELHKQRTYPIEVYKQTLENTGFSVEQVTGDFSLDTILENSLRWFFIAKKNK